MVAIRLTASAAPSSIASPDPLGKKNVIDQFPEVAARLREQAVASYEPERRAPAIHANPKMMENLRALGYVVD